jgi:2',3'-cyclic-nucleotide 2'-phosphodiesterase / 3'-nucleotidase
VTQALAQVTYPVVSANALLHKGADTSQDQPLLPPFVLLDRQIVGTDGHNHRVRIGVIGFAPPQLVDWNRMILQGRIAARNIVEAAEYYLPLMQSAGAEVVIALCHSGIGDRDPATDDVDDPFENVSARLAAVQGIDVILTGHTHQLFPGPGIATGPTVDPVHGRLHGKPAVMAGSVGSHIGVIDLVLERQDEHWAIITDQVKVEPVARPDVQGQEHATTDTDAQVISATAEVHAAVLSFIRKPIGSTAVPLHSYFSLVAPDLSLQVVADAQIARATDLLRGTEWADFPIVAAVAPSKAGGLSGALNYVDIAPGPLAMRHAAELSVFPNSFCILVLTGAELRAWLEQSAGIFATLVPGATGQPLLNPEFPCYNFDVVAGITYVVDPSRPSRTDAQGRVINRAAQRISKLCWQGNPVASTDKFLMATNSYRVGGGGGFDMAQTAQIVHHSAENTRDIVIRHLRHCSPLTAAPRRIWQFAPLPGTSAWFDSSAAALPHLPRISGQRIADAGPGPDRMQRFILDF